MKYLTESIGANNKGYTRPANLVNKFILQTENYKTYKYTMYADFNIMVENRFQ